jgi:hypothetical protein
MRPPLRIAVLECDTPLDGTRERYGGYGGVFTALLKAGAASLQRNDISSTTGLEITKWDVEKTETYPSLDDIDAILMTGSSMSLSAFERACPLHSLLLIRKADVDRAECV